MFDILQDSCSDPANDAGLMALAESRNEMKADRGDWRPLQRNELRDELVHDTYKSKKKLSEPTRCLECGAVYTAALAVSIQDSHSKCAKDIQRLLKNHYDLIKII